MVDEFNPESYERATKRPSNSSDDGPINTSDDIFESINSHVNVVGGRKEAEINRDEVSHDDCAGAVRNVPPGEKPNADPQPLRGEQMVQDAEGSKARLLAVPGNLEELLHSALLDDDYLSIGSHVDDMTQKHIVNNEYVDFAHLLPRDKLAVEEDHRMEMVNKGASPSG